MQVLESVIRRPGYRESSMLNSTDFLALFLDDCEYTVLEFTLPETNVAPENRPPQ